jgi:hypothetical protein
MYALCLSAKNFAFRLGSTEAKQRTCDELSQGSARSMVLFGVYR